MPNPITNYGTEVCGTLTRRHDSSPYYQGGQNVVAQPCVIGFKAGQSPDGGLGLEREVCPTLSATPSALEPTVCHPANVVSRDETCFTLNCMHGHDVHVIAMNRREEPE